jgi:hypothetical protein
MKGSIARPNGFDRRDATMVPTLLRRRNGRADHAQLRTGEFRGGDFWRAIASGGRLSAASGWLPKLARPNIGGDTPSPTSPNSPIRIGKISSVFRTTDSRRYDK